MRKMLWIVAIVSFGAGAACKKSDSASNARTVQNLSASYKLTGLTAAIVGFTANLYDSLPACEKDNTIQLNSNLTALFIDDNVKCDPPSDSTGTWHLSPNGDSLYVADTGNLIKSWDGKTLVLTGTESLNSVTFTTTTTLVKQ